MKVEQCEVTAKVTLTTYEAEKLTDEWLLLSSSIAASKYPNLMNLLDHLLTHPDD